MKNSDIVAPQQLYCPFAPEVNPHLEAVQEHTLAWARRFRLVIGERAIARLREAKIGSLSRGPIPVPHVTRLSSSRTGHTWLFDMLDDECDEAGIGKRPQRLTALQPSACKANFPHAI
ncbi:MAG: hypothetical protein M3461_14595 [Pseudomonadota bacterium]|nr:hypothetical protein [Pseudomonadota bacterium]